jgi:MarR family transcriptional regulator for hemolysin
MNIMKHDKNLPSYLSGAVYMKSYRILRSNVVACLELYGLTPTSWVLLGVLAKETNGVRLAEIADALNVKAPLITMMAHDLSQRGLAKRIPHHSDKRAKLLVLTPHGKQFMKKVEAEMDKTLTGLLTGLNDQDLQTYKKVLDTIIANSQL